MPPKAPSCRFRRTPKPPIPPRRKCWPSQGADVSRTGPQRVFHDFLAAGLPNLPSCRAANSAEPQMLAKSGRGCFRALDHCIFHDFLRRRSADSAGPQMLAKSGPDVFESWATAFSMTSLPPKSPKTPMTSSCQFRRASIMQGSRCLPINHIK